MLEIQSWSGLSAVILSLGCYSMLAIAAIGVFVFAFVENGSKNKDLTDGLVLGERQQNKDGYISVKDKSDLLGAIAVCSTDLRPAGTVIVEGEPVDVVTEGDFVKKGDIVKIISTEGSRVLVRRI